MFEINKVFLSDDGKTIHYDYECDKRISKYFKKEKFFATYDVDLSKVPESILVIPLLANVLPVSWFAGFNVKVTVLDKEFYHSIEKVKNQFAEYYPTITHKKLELIVGNLIETKNDEKRTTKKNAMLFSGGVDAYTTYFKHNQKDFDLITIWGADIRLQDQKQWKDLKLYLKEANILLNNQKTYIKSNFREFLTFEVERLLQDLGWWGKIQHGLGLISLTAPLSIARNYEAIFIASSYTRKPNYPFIPWGSMPEIDDKITWEERNVYHDSAELTRQEKIQYITSKAKTTGKYPHLRVCYNDLKYNLNCNECEKCLRTIFGLLITNADPTKYGLKITPKYFKLMENNLLSDFQNPGNKLFWKEMFDYASETKNFFHFLETKEESDKQINFLLELLEKKLKRRLSKPSSIERLKQEVISSFPKTFKIYLNLRRRIS